jgi:hypothetical protein
VVMACSRHGPWVLAPAWVATAPPTGA